MRRKHQNASELLQKDSVAIISYSLLLRPGCGLVIAWALGKEKRLGLETVQGKDDGRSASCRRMIIVCRRTSRQVLSWNNFVNILSNFCYAKMLVSRIWGTFDARYSNKLGYVHKELHTRTLLSCFLIRIQRKPDS